MALTDEQIKAAVYKTIFHKVCPYCNESIRANAELNAAGQRAPHPGREAGSDCNSADRSKPHSHAPPVAGLLWCRHRE